MSSEPRAVGSLKKWFIIFLFAFCAPAAFAKMPILQTQANVMIELTFTASRAYADPFNEVTLDVIFQDPRGRELRVPAFWDGSNIWKARYASPEIGKHHFRSECSNPQDAGLNGVTGVVQIKPYTGTNELYLHGPLRVSANRRYLEHLDGKPFFWLGDTWWMGLAKRLHWPEDVQALAADRKEKGFNVIQIVAGLYPDMHPFDPRGANEAGFPWETNYARIRPEYFDAADERLKYLVDQGFTPCIVGAWGYFLPWMGVDKMKAHWRNLVARYGAMPVVWCVAGEANLPWYLAKNFPYDDREQVKGWTEVARSLRATDPFHRPITIHPTGIGRLSSRQAMDDLSLIDFDMLQTPHGELPFVPADQRDVVGPTVRSVRESYADNPRMPVIDGEAAYEQLFGVVETKWTRQMFWDCLMNGAAGHTYGANGIWQNNRRGSPHGPSPTAGSPAIGYGTISWDEAMHLPGSAQVGFAKKFLEQYDWTQFRPHPEWAELSTRPMLNLAQAHWIWFPEGNPSKDAPAAKRFFRRAFVLPETNAIASARLRIAADDVFDARLNGKKLGGSRDWHSGRQFDDFAAMLQPGTNIIAVSAENMPTNVANPAGLIAAMEIQFSNAVALTLVSDDSWRCATNGADGWDAANFDEAVWQKSFTETSYGGDPWGKLDGPNIDDVHGPQSAGIPGVVRITYVPRAEPIIARSLGARAFYRAAWFDPVTGARTDLGGIQSDEAGVWNCAAPSGIDHDWVLILETEHSTAPVSKKQLTLSNEQLAWHFDWSDGHLRSTSFENKISRHSFALSDDNELSLKFSAALDHVAEPFAIIDDFKVEEAEMISSQHAVFHLRSPKRPVIAALHFQLDGPTRRKWVELTNRATWEMLLLDVALDHFTTDGLASGGGEGEPVYLEGEAFAAIEHPAGENIADHGRIELNCYLGKLFPTNSTFRSHVALVSVSKRDEATQNFVDYIQSKSVRPKKALSIYTPLGINNLWGGCPTLNDEETLDVLNQLARWRKAGMHFDYFTLDTGWSDPNSDLTRFRSTCYPDGPGKIVKRVDELGMKFGLWFATSWGAESAWDYPGAFPDGRTPGLPWREGYPIPREGVTFCIGSEQYHELLKKAVLYHVRENHVRLLKFDGGDYICNDASHGHLPGKYSIEPRMDNLIDIAEAARAAAPDVFIMWYWGLRSPFWALYGDMLFESGLHAEGSATSSFPALYYRDSVSLAQDQNAQFAKNIPPIIKDSLGTWIADDRWGNFMGKERWREALVMDLARGNLLLPNLWGDIYLFSDDDVKFIARMTSLARENQDLFLHRRTILGDPMHNEVYGYAYGKGSHGFIFLNNDDFVSRRAELRLDGSLGLDAKSGANLRVVSHFPEQSRLLRSDGGAFKSGDALQVWLRPFESLMLEVSPDVKQHRLPLRSVSDSQAADLGRALVLKPATLDQHMDIRFADAARFQGQGFKKKTYAFETTLPAFEGGPQPILAVAIQLRKGGAEWRYAPTVVQIAQAVARIGEQDVQMVPVPDSRQYGNTQADGCSWVVYKVRLGAHMSGKKLKLAIHAYLPDGVEPEIKSWVVKRWWQEDARPGSDGFYTDEPS
jgi:hypothetical protein